MQMALKNIKVPKKKARAAVHKRTGHAEPVWEGALEWTGEKFHRFRQGAFDNYYHNFKPADLMPSVWQWMKDNDFTAEDIKCAKSAPFMSAQAGIIARCLVNGMPDLHPEHAKYWESLPGTSGAVKPASDAVRKHVLDAIERGRPVLSEKNAQEAIDRAKLYKPTIQQVMHETAVNISSEIDEFMDNFDYDTQKLKEFEPDRMLRKRECKPNHARIIRKFYEGELEEIRELNTKVSKADQDEMRIQLEEGYAHLNTKQRKAYLDALIKIVDACDIIIAEAKTTRKPRKVKARSPEQVVSKLKFKTSDSVYGIASVPPAGIVGAVAALVFNCKTRKLGLYVAQDPDGFGVKGTTLTNFDEIQSLNKTVRKPDEVLPKIKKTSKPRTIKLFGELKTTETKLNGRFNEETIILNVFK